MSIINQTLRELDARRAAPAAVAAPPAAARRRRPALWVLAVLLLPLVGVAGWIAWTVVHTPAPQIARVVKPVQPEAAPIAATLPRPVSGAQLPAPAGAVEPTAVIVPPAALGSPLAPPAVTVQPAPVIAPLATPHAPSLAQPAIQRETHRPTGAEIADEYYRKALADLDAGRHEGARTALIAALDAAPAHPEARRALAALLSRSGQAAEAEALLIHGHAVVPDHPGLALSLARLQAARGDTRAAAATLLDTVGARGVGADYRATLAALLVQLDRPDEAARHYEQALRQQPGQGIWWAGLAMSLEAQGKPAEARTAYQRALQTGNLPDNLAAFSRARVGD